jgi:hypothetical protein
MEARGDVFSQSYMSIKSFIEKCEREVGDGTETIDYSEDGDKEYVVLPKDIFDAALANDIQKVLNWLGPPPVDSQRVNARCPDYLDYTLVFYAVWNKNSDLLSILLQLGADVDPVTSDGATPLSMCYEPEYYEQARLLLEWGAEISNCPTRSKDEFIERVLKCGNTQFANLLKSEFGGRRCEIINLPKHPDLNSKTCVVEKYLPDKGRYKVVFETSQEVGLVGPENLKRRDRTPDDCGYYISYENGRTTRHDFASKEECQAFVASMAEDKKSGDEDTEAEELAEAVARAEQAAASLLAELELDSSAGVSDGMGKKGKKRVKKKGRK